MTKIEMLACQEALMEALDKLPDDLWVLDTRVKGSRGRTVLEVYASGVLGCGVPAAARALGIPCIAERKNGFLEESFVLDGVKVFQLTDAGECEEDSHGRDESK